MGTEPTAHQLAEQLLAEVGFGVPDTGRSNPCEAHHAAAEPAAGSGETHPEPEPVTTTPTAGEAAEPELDSDGGWSADALSDIANPDAWREHSTSRNRAVRAIARPLPWAIVALLIAYFTLVAPTAHDRPPAPLSPATGRAVPAAPSSLEPAHKRTDRRHRKPAVQRSPVRRTPEARNARLQREPGAASAPDGPRSAPASAPRPQAPAPRPAPHVDRSGWSGEFSP